MSPWFPPLIWWVVAMILGGIFTWKRSHDIDLFMGILLWPVVLFLLIILSPILITIAVRNKVHPDD